MLALTGTHFTLELVKSQVKSYLCYDSLGCFFLQFVLKKA